MTGFKDERDYIAVMPHVTHGHATQGTHKDLGPGAEGYSLYPARAQLARYAYDDWHGGEPGCDFPIFEFGALNGYCLAALAMSVVDSRAVVKIGWCDDESTEPGSNEKCRENLASIGFDEVTVYTNRVEAPAFGRACIVAVDGSHDHENTMLDIGMAALMMPSIITLDDVIPTHAGVEDALRLCAPLFFDAFRVPTVNGLGVLSNIPGLRRKMTLDGWVTQGVDEKWGVPDGPS